MKISIIGGGYVGLVSAVCFADIGHFVTCIENDQSKFAELTQKKVPFYEPELSEKLKHVMDAGRLTIAPAISTKIFESEVIVLAVGTPMSNTGEANLDYLFDAVNNIIQKATSTEFNSIVLTTKSTVPVGTGQQIKTLVNNAGLSHKIAVASNPEFLREGSAVYDFFHPDRIVIGCDTTETFAVFKQLYKALHKDTRPITQVSLETAELAKYASNTFLATKISFINELAMLCDAVGADIKQTAKLMGMDGRIGKYFLNPSPGYGGSCFPKDTHALQFIGQQQNVNLQVVGAAINANNHQIDYCFSKLLDLLNQDLNNKTVSILGASFKPDTDDIRESATLKLIDRLLQHNVTINVTDPKSLDHIKAMYGNRVQVFDSAYDVSKNSDAIVLMTEWNAYRSLDLNQIKNNMRTPNFIDFRLIYSHNELNQAGFNSYVLGKGISTVNKTTAQA